MFAQVYKIAIVVGLSGIAVTSTARATILTVDPLGVGTNIFQTISDAVDFANLDTNSAHVYSIQITPGVYTNDYANVSRPMTLEAIGGSGVTMQSTKELPNQKGIILTTASLFIKGLTITGAFISDAFGGNGAGIRDQIGTGGSPKNGTLRIEDSIISNNQMGVLTGGSSGQEHVIVKNSKFMNNGNKPKNTGQEHALYVNNGGTVDISDSVFCGQVGQGMDIKVRSLITNITNVQTYEGIAGGGCSNPGNASRGIETPDGGITTLTNVDLFQGPDSANSAMFDFGAEGLKYADNALTMTDVNFTNTKSSAIGIQWFGGSNPCTLNNVVFTNVNTPISSNNPCVINGGGSGGGDGGGGDGGGGDGGGDGGGTPIPEPSSMIMLLSLLGLLVPAYNRRRSNK
jgi:hypothetical protein